MAEHLHQVSGVFVRSLRYGLTPLAGVLCNLLPPAKSLLFSDNDENGVNEQSRFLSRDTLFLPGECYECAKILVVVPNRKQNYYQYR